MKSGLSFIRWKFVIPVTIFIGLLAVFFIFFLDPMLARGLEALGAKVNEAKVDVSGLKTKIFKGRLTIANIQVADRGAPMTNRFEAGPMAFQLNVGEILTKRVIIPEASIDGIQFGTKRKTSGALPKKVKKKKEKDEKPSAASKLADKYKNRFKLNLDGLKGQVNEKIEFDPKELEISRQADALKVKSETLPTQWETKIESLNFEGRLKQVETDIKSLENTPTKGIEALTAIPKALEKLKKSKEELQAIKNDAKNSKAELLNEAKSLKSEVKDLKNAKKKDLDYLTSKMNLEFADPERLVEGLIGEAVLGRIQTALRYIELARKNLPSKKEKESVPKKARAGGMDIEFPKPASPPRFWLKKASLSGQVKNISVAGLLTTLTSDPPRVGKPTIFDLKGQQGPQNFKATITLDHVGDVKKDSVVLEADGFEINKLDSSGILGKAMSNGSGRGEFVFYAKGDEKIGGDINISIYGIQFDDSVLLQEIGITDGGSIKNKLQANFIKDVARSIESMKEVKIGAQLFGTWESPDIKLNSNLGKQMAGVLKKSVGNAAKNQKKELEKQLNSLLAERQSELNQKVAQLQSKLGGRFSKLDTKIQEEINKATGINLSPVKGGSDKGAPVKIPNLGDIFK